MPTDWVLWAKHQAARETSLTDWKQRGVPVAVSKQMISMLCTQQGLGRFLDREMDELALDVTVGPRYGPPEPMPPVRYCECCGQEISEWDDD